MFVFNKQNASKRFIQCNHVYYNCLDYRSTQFGIRPKNFQLNFTRNSKLHPRPFQIKISPIKNPKESVFHLVLINLFNSCINSESLVLINQYCTGLFVSYSVKTQLHKIRYAHNNPRLITLTIYLCKQVGRLYLSYFDVQQTNL